MEANKHDNDEILNNATSGEYKYGFTSDIDTHIIPKGLNEDVVRFISAKKGEPEWLLDFRLKACRHWLTLPVPEWAYLDIPPIDFQDISYYAEPVKKEGPRVLTKWTRNCSTRSTVWAYRSRSRRCSRAWLSMP